LGNVQGLSGQIGTLKQNLFSRAWYFLRHAMLEGNIVGEFDPDNTLDIRKASAQPQVHRMPALSVQRQGQLRGTGFEKRMYTLTRKFSGGVRQDFPVPAAPSCGERLGRLANGKVADYHRLGTWITSAFVGLIDAIPVKSALLEFTVFAQPYPKHRRIYEINTQTLFVLKTNCFVLHIFFNIIFI
jgi:hypothetical protein